MSQPATNQPGAKSNSHMTGLLLLIGGIVLGLLVGVFYGESMWRASGGPDRKLATLEETRKQKEALLTTAKEVEEAAAAGDAKVAATAEVERLTTQIGTLSREVDRMTKIRDQAIVDIKDGKLVLASVVGKFIRFVGDLFLQVLKLLVIPLVITSMICGITSIGDIRKIGKLGTRTIVYFMSTTTVAVFIGLMLVVIVQPGKATDDTFAFKDTKTAAKEKSDIVDTLLAVVRGDEGDKGSGMFPENLVLAAAQMNVMAVIVFSLLFGGALTTLGERGKPAIAFFDAANEAIMQMVHLTMLFAPIGIFGLVASNIAKNGGGAELGEELTRLGYYAACVLGGLLIHVTFLLTLLWLFTGRKPWQFVLSMSRAILTAMSTSSSSATLPVSMECIEGAGVSNRTARFVLPLGATINMDGTALYEAVAVVFIAQSSGIDLSIAQLVVVMLTATLAAIGAAGIPEAGLVTMVIVLTAVGLPTSGIGTILAIDWFLDRMRTSVNIFGDSVGAAIIDRTETPSAENREAT